MNRTMLIIVQLAAFGGWLAVCGCTKTTTPEVDAVDSLQPQDDTWDVYFMQGKRIGYAHTQSAVQHNSKSGRELLRIERLDHLAVKREGQTTEQDIRTISIESPQGRLIRFESEMRMGRSPLLTIGRVQGDELVLETTSAGAPGPTTTQTPWPHDAMGPLGTEQTLLRKPMQPNERRTIKMLMIGLNQAVDVEMTARDYEPTAMLNGVYDLLKIDTVTQLPDGQKIAGTVWADRTGNTLKTSSQTLGLESYRVTKAEALDSADTAEFDLLTGTFVKVARPLPDAHHTHQVRYRVHLKDGDPAGVFTTGPGQSVTSIDPHTAEIVVDSIRPGQSDGNRNAPPDAPTEADLHPNTFVQSDDPLIVADAKEAAADLTDPWSVAKALEDYVHRKVRNKNYSQAFASAAEVAKSLEGDCTEHAVFLAALARARGIPARVAIGLVYMKPEQGFGYHMWTEVYIEDRWIPIDGTLALGGIGAGHLKIGQTNLEGASIYSTFLPVVQILGQLDIEVVDVK